MTEETERELRNDELAEVGRTVSRHKARSATARQRSSGAHLSVLELLVPPLRLLGLCGLVFLVAAGAWAFGSYQHANPPHASPIAKGSGVEVDSHPAYGPQSLDYYGNWPTFYQNPERTANASVEPTISAANVSALTTAWQFNSTGPVEGSLAVVNGTAYVGSWSSKGLYALEANLNSAYGVSLWNSSVGSGWVVGKENSSSTPCYQGAPGTGVHTSWQGVTSTPVVQGDFVYVGGGNTFFYAINATKALNVTYSWRADLGNDTWNHNGTNNSNPNWAQDYIWSSPLLWKGSIYIGMASGCDGKVAGQLFQLNQTTGNIVNVFNATNPGQYGATIWSTPTIDPATDTIWISTGNEYEGTTTVNGTQWRVPP